MKIFNLFKKRKTTVQNEFFTYFEQLFFADPYIFYWIKAFPNKNGRYILTFFRNQQFAKYSGLEIVIFDREQVTYHRLPGAKPNGRGNVSLGKHFVSLNSMNEKEYSYICVNKVSNLSVDLHFAPVDLIKKCDYVYLPCRKLSYNLFLPELIDIVLFSLEWNYLSLQLTKDKKIYKKDNNIFSKILTGLIENTVEEKIIMSAQRVNQAIENLNKWN